MCSSGLTKERLIQESMKLFYRCLFYFFKGFADRYFPFFFYFLFYRGDDKP
uniref:Uncharacterized protein n=1 Tax=Rhizophora mucronata TaxID=61149 RepID=A0A2P2NQ73_RHIMU